MKVTVKLTKLAHQRVTETREHLEEEHGPLATDAAAVEFLIRKATGTPLDA